MTSIFRAIALACLFTLPAYAALPVGASAPDFTAKATKAGNTFDFSLRVARQNGPVVLYFYPKAFTSGCTYEAHAFAEAVDRFARLGATVVGVSNDSIDVLDKFSVEECAGKFAVVADTESKVIRSYNAKMAIVGNAARISYVIAPDGKILFVHDAMDPDGHVGGTLKAVQDWRAAHPATTPQP